MDWWPVRVVSGILAKFPLEPVLRERLVLFKERLELEQSKLDTCERQKAYLQDRYADLQKAHDALQALNADLQRKFDQSAQEVHRQQEDRRPQLDHFTENSGALFKRSPAGGYHRAVYCPRCRTSTAPFPPRTGNYICDRCDWSAAFGQADLDRILAELP